MTKKNITTKQIIKMLEIDKKSVREIGRITGWSHTYIGNVIDKYYKDNPDIPDMRPKAQSKVKIVIKGHRRDENKKISEAANLVVGGYSANVIERMVKNNGPYSYLQYRNTEGSVVTRYIDKAPIEVIDVKLETGMMSIEYKNDKGEAKLKRIKA